MFYVNQSTIPSSGGSTCNCINIYFIIYVVFSTANSAMLVIHNSR